MPLKVQLPTLAGALFLVLAAVLVEPAALAHTRITTDVTWGEEIRPILREHCMRCHSPGGIAPDYADFTVYGTDSQPGARAWATAIEEEILTGRMPPWQADRRFDVYKNTRGLTKRETDLILAWVRGGAPQGPRRNLPPPPEFVDDWVLGEPDLVVAPDEEYVLEAGKWEDQTSVVVPVAIQDDTWITGYEFKPGNPRSVYSIDAYILDPEGEPESLEVEVQVPYDPFALNDKPEPTRMRKMPSGHRFLARWLWGDEPLLFPDGAGQRLRQGSRLELRITYRRQEDDGASDDIRDLSKLGLFLAQNVDEVNLILESHESEGDGELELRGKKASKPQTVVATLPEAGHLMALHPRLGDQAESVEIRAVFPDDRVRTLVWIPDYDPQWPSSFVLEEPLEVMPGTRIEMEGTFRPPAGKQTVTQAFALDVDYTLDDHLVLPAPPPTPPQPADSSRGGMLTDVFSTDLPASGGTGAAGTPGDPNAGAHMDHSPLHGGQFFMAANQYHHLEGALPNPGEFRLYVYDDFKKPVDPRNFSGRVVFEQFDEGSGEYTETEFPLEPVAGTDYLTAQIEKELPSEFFAAVNLAGKETRFDFYFTETTVEPVGVPSGPGLTRAGPHTHVRPPLVIPETATDIVDAILGSTKQLVAKIDNQDWPTLYIPAFDAKDLSEALLGRLDAVSARDRGKVRRGVSRILQSTVEMERAADLVDEPRVRQALDRYETGLRDIVDVFPAGGR